ncbi:MAG: energy-coupling factor ABC transporter ATP-binding protein [Spirochaetes bacterium]|nr:energy-coupling factor ABC transporter ATP-binding protein [Spirochaetota bacterium]
MNPKGIFRIQNLKVEFNGRGELFHIPLWDIPPHDCLAVMGPNGSGKTTFLKVLSGLLSVPTGTILYQGIPIQLNRNRLAQDVTYVHQHPYLFRGSVYGNLVASLLSKPLSSKERMFRIQDTLETLGLRGYEDRDTRGLSGGEAYRVALARALVREPQVLLLDEPTAQADQEAKRIVINALQQVVRRENTALIFSTHDEDLCKDLEARILRLEEFAPCRY